MNKLFALLSILLFSFSYGQYYKAELLYKDGNTEKGLLNSLVDINNRKAKKAVFKSDEKACQRAFLSAVKQLQEKAEASGATKVGNIVSYYKKNTFKSTSQYECHAGHLIGGVALKGDIVR